MILEKTTLQEKFSKLENLSDGCVLQFRKDPSDDTKVILTPVKVNNLGILPQIKVTVPDTGVEDAVTCKDNNNVNISCSARYPRGESYTSYYFNVPTLGNNYTVTYNGSTQNVSVEIYQQYPLYFGD